MNTPPLKTERLILRRFTKDDINALFLILNDPEVNKFLPWFPVKSIGEAEKFYEERYIPVYARQRGYAYAVCLKDDNIPIGYIGIDAEAPTTSDTDFAKSSGTRGSSPKRGAPFWSR